MSEPRRQLYRSRDDRMIAGICGGVAAFFHVDASLIRLLAAALVLLGGGPWIVLLYLILIFVIPQPPLGEASLPAPEPASETATPDLPGFTEAEIRAWNLAPAGVEPAPEPSPEPRPSAEPQPGSGGSHS